MCHSVDGALHYWSRISLALYRAGFRPISISFRTLRHMPCSKVSLRRQALPSLIEAISAASSPCSVISSSAMRLIFSFGTSHGRMDSSHMCQANVPQTGEVTNAVQATLPKLGISKSPQNGVIHTAILYIDLWGLSGTFCSYGNLFCKPQKESCATWLIKC